MSKQEALINWTESAELIERKIRGYQPWPVAHCVMADNTVKIQKAEVIPEHQGLPGQVLSADKTGIVIATGQGALKITQLQPPGKKAMSAADFINGRLDWVETGTQLSSASE